MEQAWSCYSPGGAVIGNRRVPAQRLPIPYPFSRKEKQSRMSEAQVGMNEEAQGRQMGPCEDFCPRLWPPERGQQSRWNKRPYSTLLLPGFVSWNEETNGTPNPPNLSCFGAAHRTLFLLQGSAPEERRISGGLWAEGLEQYWGGESGEQGCSFPARHTWAEWAPGLAPDGRNQWEVVHLGGEGLI